MQHTAKRWAAWIVCSLILITTLISPATAAETVTDDSVTREQTMPILYQHADLLKKRKRPPPM